MKNQYTKKINDTFIVIYCTTLLKKIGYIGYIINYKQLV